MNFFVKLLKWWKRDDFIQILLNRSKRDDGLLPKIIHQIWIGPKPPPLKLLNSWRRHHSSWHHQLWTEKELKKINFINQAAIDATPNFSGKCDIMRYEILHRFGGIFLDADSYCFKSLEDGDFLNQEFSAYVGKEYSDRLANGYIGCLRGSNLMKVLINHIKKIPLDVLATSPSWKTTGPLFFTEIIKKIKYQIHIYPDWVFCPVHYTGKVTPNWQKKNDIFGVQYWNSTYSGKGNEHKRLQKQQAIEHFITLYHQHYKTNQKIIRYKEIF